MYLSVRGNMSWIMFCNNVPEVFVFGYSGCLFLIIIETKTSSSSSFLPTGITLDEIKRYCDWRVQNSKCAMIILVSSFCDTWVEWNFVNVILITLDYQMWKMLKYAPWLQYFHHYFHDKQENIAAQMRWWCCMPVPWNNTNISPWNRKN